MSSRWRANIAMQRLFLFCNTWSDRQAGSRLKYKKQRKSKKGDPCSVYLYRRNGSSNVKNIYQNCRDRCTFELNAYHLLCCLSHWLPYVSRDTLTGCHSTSQLCVCIGHRRWLRFRNVTPQRTPFSPPPPPPLPPLLPFPISPPLSVPSVILRMRPQAFCSLPFCCFFFSPSAPLLSSISLSSLYLHHPAVPSHPHSPSATSRPYPPLFFFFFALSLLQTSTPLLAPSPFCSLFKMHGALSKITQPTTIHFPLRSPHLSPPPSLLSSLPSPSFLCCLTQTNQGGLSSGGC